MRRKGTSCGKQAKTDSWICFFNIECRDLRMYACHGKIHICRRRQSADACILAQLFGVAQPCAVGFCRTSQNEKVPVAANPAVGYSRRLWMCLNTAVAVQLLYVYCVGNGNGIPFHISLSGSFDRFCVSPKKDCLGNMGERGTVLCGDSLLL